MANKSFKIESKVHGTCIATVPSEEFDDVSQFHWYLDVIGKNKTLVARTRHEDGSRTYLHRRVFAVDNRLVPKDENFLNCTYENMKILNKWEF